MITIKTNLPQVMGEIDTIITHLGSDKLMRLALFRAIKLIYERVHEDGLDANNQPIGTQTGKSVYNEDYFLYRKKKNRLEPISKKVLQLTGKTSDDFTIGSFNGEWQKTWKELQTGSQIPLFDKPTPQGWAIGWANNESSEIAQHQIDMHGNVYELTDAEAQAVIDTIEFEFFRILNGEI